MHPRIGDTFNDFLNHGEERMAHPADRETSFHQISPYIGRLRPGIARRLIMSYTNSGQTILDPFAGSGTVPLEALLSNRSAIASEINPYGYLLSKAKMFPPPTLNDALARLETVDYKVATLCQRITIDNIPLWIRQFFHPKTLAETLTYAKILREQREYFLLACLMGILHHQRPGFLSFPASHSVPYLRSKKFPKETFPEMYEYKEVKSRLSRKVKRMYKSFSGIPTETKRICVKKDASQLKIGDNSVDAIITSPPYMDALSYGRDNRLRLWFLGVENYERYDRAGPKNEREFKNLIKSTLENIEPALRQNAPCIFILGDVQKGKRTISTSKLLLDVAINEMKGFHCESISEDFIPIERRVRRGCSCTKAEMFIVLRYDGGSV